MDKTNAKRATDRPPAQPAGQDEEDGTRDRILKTAERLFAERGFNGVSVRELAAAASVNIASIGYHFRSKERLYVAAFEYIASQLRARLGPVVDALESSLEKPATGASKEQLRDRHLELLLRVVDGALALFVRDESADWAQLIVREQRRATEAFVAFHSGFAERTFGVLTRVVLGIRASDEETARLTVVSILGQMLVFRVARAAVLRQLRWSAIGESELSALQRHVRANITAQLLAPSEPPRGPPPTAAKRSPRGTKR
jgi:TetR/AcrR family transcriptional regulator, regulator of cefoperazone and chloramphenicol sensitivity